MMIDSGLDGSHNDVESECDGGGQDERSHQLNKDDKSHREAESSTKIVDLNELGQIVHSRVNPSSTLREKNKEGIRYDSLANSLRHKHHFPLGECLEHQCRQVSIFTKQEKILLVQRVDNILRIVLDNVGIGNDGHPVTVGTLWRLDSVGTKASGQTSDTAKAGFKGLCLVVRDVVLKDWRGRSK